MIIDKGLSTKVTDEDIAIGVKDKYGAFYSSDGKRLLQGVDCVSYCIRPGTQVICDGAFSSCSHLYSINIPNSVILVGNDAFEGCSDLSSIIIPESVLHIGSSAFAGCNFLSSITIPNTVTTIGDSVFKDCTNLPSIIIPNSVSHIGDSAFFGCHNLREITISDSITHIGDNAFCECISLKGIILPDSVIYIGDDAFYYCDSMTQIEIPDKVKHIGKYAFSKCSSLSSIRVSNNNKIYDSRGNSNAIIHTATNTLIAGCEKTIIPISVSQIGEGAFYGCDGISNITIPESVALIGFCAFSCCRSLSSITIPHSVTYIGDDAFSDCSCLTSIQVSKNNKIYDSREDCNAIIQTATNTLIVGCENTIIPNSVTHIGSKAFYYCSGLVGISIPNSVTHIGDGAFYGCSLSSITIPNSVTHIGENAFCCSYDKLTSIIIPNGSLEKFLKLIRGSSSDLLTEEEEWKRIQAAIVTDEEIACGVKDEYGAIYSHDGTRLLKGPNIPSYEIKLGTKIICNGAFYHYAIDEDDIWDYGYGYIYNSVLKTIVIPDSVEAIGDRAFYFCKELTKVDIPDSVIHIGVRAFSRCESLRSINIPDSVIRIRKEAFFVCKSLTSINIPNSIIHISEKAFSECSSLTNVNIPDSVNYIGYYAFYNCKHLASITLPNSISHISETAFEWCDSLSEIRIPVGSYDKYKKLLPGLENKFRIYEPTPIITQISTEVTDEDLVNGIKDGFGVLYSPDGKRLLKGANYASYCIRPGTQVICAKAFSDCKELKKIIIPESVTHISYSVFLNCSSLESIKVSSNNKTYDSRENCNAIIHTASNTLIVGCGNTVIPNSVTHIGNFAFWGCNRITSISIPNSVIHIGKKAFSFCANLARISISESITHIGFCAFYFCEALNDIFIPSSVTYIGENAFNGCCNLTSIKVSENNKTFDSRKNCNAIIHTATNTLIFGFKDTIIPDSVTRIGDWAFWGCVGLSNISIPNSVTHIGKGAFASCLSLTKIIIPNSVMQIGVAAFSHCKGLTNISISNSVTRIEEAAFNFCENLRSVTIPHSVAYIGYGVFSACKCLQGIEVSKNNKIFDSRDNCNAIIHTETNTLLAVCEHTTIPKTVTRIGKHAFMGCDFTNIKLPNSITHIDDEAFRGCSVLARITIPDTVKYIGIDIFNGCKNLVEIHIPAGSYERFIKLLPGFESKFVEDDKQPSDPGMINRSPYQIPENYDSYQQEVIKLDKGYNLVLAPPGCGKTDILAERIARARSNGISFSDMLCLTFTNRAARGMRDRIAKRLGKDVDTSSLFVGNTHRFCSKFLFEQNLVPMSTSILDENDTTDIVESLIKKYKKGYEAVSYSSTRIFQLQHLIYQMKSDHPQEMWMNLSCIQDIRGLCHYLNLELCDLYDRIEDVDDNQYPPTYREAFRHIYLAKKYEEYKLNFGAIDFDDLLLMAYNFLSDSKSEFHKYSWIQIDEVQDLNPIQFAIVDKLTNDNNFVVVYLGDEQQAIFSFIGAKLQTLDWLKKRCEGNLLHLYKNYRSPKYLLDVYNKFANDVLDADPDFLPEPNDSKEAEFGDLIVDHAAEDTFEEYDRVVDYAEKYAKTGERVAIIVATNKDADEISDSMGDLKHFKISGQDVFSTPEIQMLLAHMNVINYELNNIAWAKIFRQMKLFGESARARDFSKSLVEHMLSPVDLLQYELSSFVKEVTKAFEDEMVIFDTETTGLDVYEDDIVQIAAIRIQDGEVVEKYNIFLKTDKQIPEYLGEIRNPLFDEYPNAEKYDRDEGLRMFLEFVGTTPILGHNVEYDYHILDYNLQRDCGIENLNDICPFYYDSLKLARLVEPHLKVYKLKSLLEVLGLQGENSHMADDDILATYELVKYCVNKAKLRLNSQMDFMVSNHEIIENFRKEYGPIYEHTKAMLYKRFPYDDTPAIVQEMDYIYNELKDKGIIKSNSKFKHILKFIEFDVIQKETERSLFEQLSNHSSELNTFKEADLCDSSTMEEKYFISTVHKAKGLEFENVIVFNAIDGVYPFFNSKTVEEQKEDARKFYVAISRAKKRLCIMTSKTKDVYSTKWHKWYNFKAEPSPFLGCISEYFKYIYNSDE